MRREARPERGTVLGLHIYVLDRVASLAVAIFLLLPLAVGPAFADSGPGLSASLALRNADAPGQGKSLAEDKAQLVQSSQQSFDIPAGDLQAALSTFSRQVDLQLIYPAEMTAGRQTQGVQGEFTPQQALDRLLSDTGLGYRFTDASTVTLERAVVDESGPTRLDPITVDAVLPGTLTDSYNAPDSFAATRTDTPSIDTPQSTQSVTRQALEDAGATEVSDAYDYLAGVQRANTGGGVFGDAYRVRGFEGDNLLYNGNRTGRPVALDTANVERVEAIRGPTATLFGRADPGGAINVVTKQPLAEPLYQFDLQGGTGFFGDGSRYRDVRATVDTGGPIDEQGRIRYRFNAAAEYEQSFRQDIDATGFFVSPVVDFEIDDRTVANLEVVYQFRQEPFDRGVPFIDGKPELDPDFNVAKDQTDDLDKHYTSATFRLDRELTDALTARLGLYASYGDLTGEAIQLDSVNGSTGQVERRDFKGSDVFLTAQPELLAEFGTWSLGHTVLFGVDASFQKNRLQNRFGQPGAPFDLFDPDFPVDAPQFSEGETQYLRSRLQGKSLGIYAQDQVDISDQWKLLLGLRWDAVWLTDESRGLLNNRTRLLEGDENFRDTALLPRAGIVYQPIEEVGIYASYSETYRPPTGGRLLDSQGDQVKPEEGRSLEFGIKLEALDGRLGGTLAAYRTDKENLLVNDPDEFPPFGIFQTNIGRVRSQGVEFDLAGDITKNISIGVTYAYTDARVSSNDDPNFPKGTRLINVPRHAASLQAAYSFTEGPLQGLRFFGSMVYEDDKPTLTSATERTRIPDYVRFDLGASYDITENIQARLLIRNLTDEEYYTYAASDRNVFPGQPFNAVLGIRARF